MDSKQMFMILAIVAPFSSAMIATPAMAQNTTGGNMTGGNMTGGNMTGKISGGGIMGLTAQGAQDVYLTGPSQSVPTPPPTDLGDVEDQDQSEDQSDDEGEDGGEAQDQSEDEGEEQEEGN